jgi:hypothetical protein
LPFQNDVFLKDLSLCRGQSLACVSLIVERDVGYSRRVLVSGGFAQALSVSRRLLLDRLRNQPFLEIHAHTPLLADFNESGWNTCYEMCAEVLDAEPEQGGIIGTTWFVDPVIARISPRLAYLRRIAAEAGGEYYRVGTSSHDVRLAIATSAARRTLFEQGLYQPTAYLMIWPRARVLQWVEGRRRDAASATS